jgi:excisionase family DNA binding protein
MPLHQPIRPASFVGKGWTQKNRKLKQGNYEYMTKNLTTIKKYKKIEALRNLGLLMENLLMENLEKIENFKFVTEPQAAKILKISYSKLKSLRQQKRIAFCRIGASIRYKVSQLQDFVEQGVVEAEN